MASLYDRPDLYDLVAPAGAAMAGFYVEAAKSNGPSVLELACGTGRLTVELVEAELEVVGGDLSEVMLARANQAAAERGMSIETRLLDMRDFDLGGRRFETVMIAANSLMHLLTPDDFAGFFASVKRHLAPGGKLLFDIFVPSASLLNRPGQRQALTEFIHPDLGKVTVEEIIDYDPISQIAHTEWFWSTESERDFLRTPLQLRQFFPQELPLLVRANGFQLVERFGDFERNPLTAATWRQVCICKPVA